MTFWPVLHHRGNWIYQRTSFTFFTSHQEPFPSCSVSWWKWSANIHSSLTYSPSGTSFSQRRSCSVICSSYLKQTWAALHFSETKPSCVPTWHQRTSGWDKRGRDEAMIWWDGWMDCVLGLSHYPDSDSALKSYWLKALEHLWSPQGHREVQTPGSEEVYAFHLSNPKK